MAQCCSTSSQFIASPHPEGRFPTGWVFMQQPMGISSAMAYEGSTALPSAAAPQLPQKETTYSGPALSRDGLKLQSLKDLKHQAPKCISANICQYLQYVFYIYIYIYLSPHLWMYERNFLPKMLLDVIPICQLGIALPCRSAMQHQGTDTPALRAAPAPTHIHFISNLKNGADPQIPSLHSSSFGTRLWAYRPLKSFSLLSSMWAVRIFSVRALVFKTPDLSQVCSPQQMLFKKQPVFSNKIFWKSTHVFTFFKFRFWFVGGPSKREAHAHIAKRHTPYYAFQMGRFCHEPWPCSSTVHLGWNIHETHLLPSRKPIEDVFPIENGWLSLAMLVLGGCTFLLSWKEKRQILAPRPADIHNWYPQSHNRHFHRWIVPPVATGLETVIALWSSAGNSRHTKSRPNFDI